MVDLADKKTKGKQNMKTLAMKICTRTIAVAALAAAHATFAQDGDIRTGEANGLTWTYQVTSERTAKLVESNYNPSISLSITNDIVIPQAIDGYPVTAIGTRAFLRCNISGVTIPSSVETIEEMAFADCTNISHLVLSEGLKSIGIEAFSGDSGIVNLTIPASVTLIDEFAFWLCTNLTSITVLGSNTDIDATAFEDCDSISELYLPSNAKNSTSAKSLSNAVANVSIKTLAAFDGNCESFMTKLTPTSTPGGKWQITAFASVADGTADGLCAANVHLLYGRDATALATDAAARLVTATNAVMVRLEFDAPDADVRYYKVKFGY